MESVEGTWVQRLVWIEAKDSAKAIGTCRVLASFPVWQGAVPVKELIGENRYKVPFRVPVPIAGPLDAAYLIEDEQGVVVDVVVNAGGMRLPLTSDMYSFRETTLNAEFYALEGNLCSAVHQASKMPQEIVGTIGKLDRVGRVGGLRMTAPGWSVSMEGGNIVVRHALISDVTVSDWPVRCLEQVYEYGQKIVTVTGMHYPFSYRPLVK